MRRKAKMAGPRWNLCPRFCQADLVRGFVWDGQFPHEVREKEAAGKFRRKVALASSEAGFRFGTTNVIDTNVIDAVLSKLNCPVF